MAAGTTAAKVPWLDSETQVFRKHLHSSGGFFFSHPHRGCYPGILSHQRSHPSSINGENATDIKMLSPLASSARMCSISMGSTIPSRSHPTTPVCFEFPPGPKMEGTVDASWDPAGLSDINIVNIATGSGIQRRKNPTESLYSEIPVVN